MRWIVPALVAFVTTGCSGLDCDELTERHDQCLDDFCDGGDHPFCDCWDRGLDMSLADCSCVPYDAQLTCDVYEDLDLQVSDYNCASVQASLRNICD